MEVEVVDGLAAVGTVVDDDTIAIRETESPGKFWDHAPKMADERGIGVG